MPLAPPSLPLQNHFQETKTSDTRSIQISLKTLDFYKIR